MFVLANVCDTLYIPYDRKFCQVFNDFASLNQCDFLIKYINFTWWESPNK